MVKRMLRAYLGLLILSVCYCVACGVILFLAAYQADQEHPEKALRLYRTLATLAPGAPGVLVSQGWCECQLGHCDQARILAERARAQDPNDPEVANLLGQIAYLEGNYQEALEQWKHDELGRGWVFLATKHYAEARECLKKCPADTPGLEKLRQALDDEDPQ